jgi:hypothetical protein
MRILRRLVLGRVSELASQRVSRFVRKQLRREPRSQNRDLGHPVPWRTIPLIAMRLR